MRKVKLLITILLVGAIGLSGCEQAPANTVDGNESQETGENREATGNQGAEGEQKTAVAETEKYVSFAEAKEQVNQLKGNRVNGFTFSEQFDMPETDSISSLKIEQNVSQDVAVVEETLSNIWDVYDNVDWSKIEERIFTRTDKEYKGITKEDPATGYFFSSDSDGFFCGNSLGNSQLSMSDCVKEYDFLICSNFEDVKNDKYMLKDGEITIGDAVAYVEGKLNEHLVSLEKGLFEYKVQKLYVLRDASTETYELSMTVGRVYDGVAMTTVSDFNIQRGNVFYDYIHCGDHIIIRMRNANKIDNINFSNNSIDIEDIETKDSIISPLWAVQEMDEQIANTGTVSFRYCGLVYVITQKNYKYDKKEQASYSSPDLEVTYIKPYWMFSNLASSDSEDVLAETVLVDAIDGTLYYYHGTGAYPH